MMKSTIKVIVVVITAFVIVALFIQYVCSVSESYLRRHLNKQLDWLKQAKSSSGKLMKKTIETVLNGHDTKEMLIKLGDSRNFLKREVPCYNQYKRQGPTACNCADCTVKNICMLCVSKKRPTE